jgi:Protein of unknown function (DUF4233)
VTDPAAEPPSSRPPAATGRAGAARRDLAGAQGGRVHRVKRALRGVFAAVLSLESLAVLFVPRAIAQFGAGLTALRLVFLLGLAGLLLLAAFLQRWRAGLALGSVLQLAIITTGLLTGAMYVVGGLFTATWIYLLRVRRSLLRTALSRPPQ